MAIENMFIASSVTSGCLLGVLVYLHFMSKDDNWRDLFMSAIFLCLIYMFDVIRVGFDEVIVHNGLGNITWAVLHILLLSLVIMWMITMLRIVLRLLEFALMFLTGRGYGKKD